MDSLPPPLPYRSPTPVLDYRPRFGRLIAAGILLLLTAGAFGVLGIALPMLTADGATSLAYWQHYLVDSAGYLVATAIFGVLGFGALLGRRWSRPLIMILATQWLLVGSLSLVGMVLFLPAMLDMMAMGNSELPTELVAGLLIGLAILVVVGMVIWPGVLYLLVRHDDVRRTCESRDPHRRWTDGRPVNIVGLEVTLYLAAVLFLLSGLQPVLPFFGLMLHGSSKFALAAAAAIGSIIAAVEVHRLRPAGWWLGLLTTVVPLLAYVPGAWTTPIREYYLALGTDPRSMAMFTQHPGVARFSIVAFPIGFSIGFAIYMVRLRKAYVATAKTYSLSR